MAPSYSTLSWHELALFQPLSQPSIGQNYGDSSDGKQPSQITAALSEYGFHWNNRRQVTCQLPLATRHCRAARASGGKPKLIQHSAFSLLHFTPRPSGGKPKRTGRTNGKDGTNTTMHGGGRDQNNPVHPVHPVCKPIRLFEQPVKVWP